MTGQAPGERWIANALHRRYSVFQPCGTAALELALLTLGIQHGDEVIIPEECCTAVLGAVARVGARAVLAQVDEQCLLTPASVSEAITENTRAAIAIHQWGARVNCGDIRAAVPPHVAIMRMPHHIGT